MQNRTLWWEKVNSFHLFLFKSQNVLTTSLYRWGIKNPEQTSDLPRATHLAGSKTRARILVF